MTKHNNDEGISRRDFLKVAAVTAVAATATGAGAAVLSNGGVSLPSLPSLTSLPAQPAASATIQVAPAAAPVISSAHTEAAAADALARLASSQAENMRLQAELDAARRSLEALQLTTSESGSAAEALSIELASANQRVGLLSGLVALYEQLEDVDVAGVLDEGMSAVSEAVGSLLSGVPTLSEGIEVSRQALTDLDGHIPLLQNGRAWVQAQANKLQLYFQAIETLVARAVDTVGPFLIMLNLWVQDILKWLPFGLGRRTSDIMQAVTSLLEETPHTISGLKTNVVQPLDVWLAGDADDIPLRRNLIRPIRERVLDKAGETLAQVQQVQATYQARLADPAQTAVRNQDTIRDLIAQYRQEHQV